MVYRFIGSVSDNSVSITSMSVSVSRWVLLLIHTLVENCVDVTTASSGKCAADPTLHVGDNNRKTVCMYVLYLL